MAYDLDGNGIDVSTTLLEPWLDGPAHNPLLLRCAFYIERKGARADAVKSLAERLVEYYVGSETILRAGGFEKAADLVRNSLPTYKKIRSGDLAELLATEFLREKTPFQAPILKLRYKSDRNTALHGDDVIAINRSSIPPALLKGEVKSRASFGKSHLPDAIAQLDANNGYPNPSSLAFVTKRLYEQGRDEEAAVFQQMQCEGELQSSEIVHLLFVVCGNDCGKTLMHVPDPKNEMIGGRCSAAIRVADHQSFVESVFETCHGV